MLCVSVRAPEEEEVVVVVVVLAAVAVVAAVMVATVTTVTKEKSWCRRFAKVGRRYGLTPLQQVE